MKNIKVFLADDHLLFRQGIKSLLSKVADIEILGEASDGEETIAKVHKLKPDVVLMDITMPKINGLEATKLIKEKLPSVKILILTMHDTDQYLAGMLEAICSAFGTFALRL